MLIFEVLNLCGVSGDGAFVERPSLFAPEYFNPMCSSKARVFLSVYTTLLPTFEALALDFIPFGVEDPNTRVDADDTACFCYLSMLTLLLVTALKLPKFTPRILFTSEENFESAVLDAAD
ncbi:hypothetical protein FXO38_35356 [Capsicum annuum]|nr:hypothetical protein FXO38_35356 [Capsicum annuum]KAF3618508.1 hypothetical protein FXO37_34162 [Capsicum annuum]